MTAELSAAGAVGAVVTGGAVLAVVSLGRRDCDGGWIVEYDS